MATVASHTLTDEQLRILRAARDCRLGINFSGRYVIEGEPRPIRKDREVLQRWGYLGWSFTRTAPVITATGRGALAHAERTAKR